MSNTNILFATAFVLFALNGCGGSTSNTTTQVQNNDNNTTIDANITDDQKSKIVQRHNYYRDLVSTPTLEWDETLASHAQAWVDYLAEHYSEQDAANGTSPHAQLLNPDFYHNEGENIARSTAHNGFLSKDPLDISVEHTLKELTDNNVGAIDAWASEGYYYNNGITGHATGHYTQIVWKNTTKVGCAKAVSKVYKFFNNIKDVYYEWVVCRYSPAGNIQGEKPF